MPSLSVTHAELSIHKMQNGGECVFKGQLEVREGVSCHLNYPLHVGSICAMLKCMCVCVFECGCGCVSLVEVGGCCGRYAPPYSPLLLYKADGGIGTFVTLLPDTETITLTGHTNTLDTHIPQRH